MPKLFRTWIGPALTGGGLAVSCMNDYEQFEFIPPVKPLDAGPSGGTAGSSQGSGGLAGSGGTAGRGGTGGGGTAGSSGTGGGGTAGSSGTGGAGTAGSGGTGGGGTAGSAGQSGTGGSACGQYEVLCGTTCVDGRTPDDCGGCNNDCGQQGYSAGLQCVDMVCGCTASSQCTSGSPSQGARCSTLAARCICSGNQCGPGEVCDSGNDCSCNGGPSCSAGQVCCQMTGCQTSCE